MTVRRIRGILLALAVATGRTAAAAGFPTWTQDAPNVQALARTPLDVDVRVETATATHNRTTWTQHDLVLLAYEGLRAEDDTTPYNATTNRTAPSTTLPIFQVDGLDELQASQVNATAVGTTSPAVLLLGNQTMLRTIRTHCGNHSVVNARTLGRRLAAVVQEGTTESTLVVLASLAASKLTTVALWSEWAAAFYIGFYQERRYLGTFGGPRMAVVPQVTLVVDDDDAAATVMQQGLARGRILAQAIALSRDIVNAPHNVLNSLSLAATAVALARDHRATLRCRILSVDDCERLGMGAFLGVARGSETTAKFIHLTYTPRAKADRTFLRKLGIVGKGLLFDTGGYNIKTGMGMTNMKFDCGGAAAVLGAAYAIAALEPAHVEVHFLIAACENMINERAMVPGDVLVASNGKTIEVLNTDAEGRLTMADALVYADQTLECEEILELSTLTGACMAALGSAMAGLFTHDDGMAKAVLSAAETCGDKVWRMPMEEDYADDIKSKVADIKNIGGRFGGAITAALFLQNFVQNAKFAHVDMAGPVWDYKAGLATGWGSRLVTDWVMASQPAP